jgi:ferrous iron transport protein B
MFFKKAGTILLAVSIVLWVLMSFPKINSQRSAEYASRIAKAANEKEAGAIRSEERREALAGSVAGRLGQGLTSITWLAGFDWRENIALIGGLAAKEVVVCTFGTAYALDNGGDEKNSASLSALLRADKSWSPLRACVTMIFVMLYSPCIATLAVMRRETGGWRWPAFATLYTTLLAFIAAVAIFQLGSFFGWGG